MYQATVKNPKRNFVVLGILGLLVLGFSSASYLKQGQKWPGGMTLGVLATICALQGMTGARQSEIDCTWRIFRTFFLLAVTFEALSMPRAPFENWVLTVCWVPVAIYLVYQLWRRPPVEG